jgi:hypothetical protein
MIRDRVMAVPDRARSSGKRLGRPRTTLFKVQRIREALYEGRDVRETARLLKVSAATVSEIRRWRRPRLICNSEPERVRVTDSLPIRKEHASDACWMHISNVAPMFRRCGIGYGNKVSNGGWIISAPVLDLQAYERNYTSEIAYRDSISSTHTGSASEMR